MSLPSIAWTEQVARQCIDKFLRAWGRQRSMVGDGKSGFYSKAASLSLALCLHPALGHLETTIPRMLSSNFRDPVSRAPEVVVKAKAPESLLAVVSSVCCHHGEATAPERQDVSWATSLVSARLRAEGHHLLKASALTGAVSPSAQPTRAGAFCGRINLLLGFSPTPTLSASELCL